MKVEFIGFRGERQHHQDWAFELFTETDFEKTFLNALFESDAYHPTRKIRQMQPIAALLCSTERGLSIMVSAENFCESELVKARQRITELEQALTTKQDKQKNKLAPSR